MSIIKSIAFENKIQIFFDYFSYEKGNQYDFYVNGKKVGSTTKNHFLIDKLKANTLYEVDVKKNGELFARKDIYTLFKRKIIKVPVSKGETLLTKQLQEILDNASGKTVVFPKGTYLTGALFVRPDTHIKLEKGALLLGSDKVKDYSPKIHSRFEGLTMDCYASLINIGVCNEKRKRYQLQNVYIYGEGEIRGGGKKLCHKIIKKELPNVDTSSIDPKKTNANVLAGRARGRLIQFNNSEGLIIEGLKLGYSPSWNIHPIYSKNIAIFNCRFESKDLHNGDGIDPDSCENVFIFNNYFDTGDDCVAVKSGRNPDGNKIHRPTKNVHVFDCKSKTGHGCCIGSEMSGGIEDVYFFDCDFSKTRFGVQIKTTRKRGGYVRNVFVEDVKISAINIRCVTYNDEGVGSKKLAKFENFVFKNIYLTGVDIGNYGNETTEINHIEIKGFNDNKKAFRDFYIENIKYKGKARVVVENSTNTLIK